jgi:exonuclease SbcC
MKLKLTNFRCYSEKTFDFGENNLSLLSAPSGSGKSSILMGINFALFGLGNKIVSFGQSTSIVELTYDDLQITRKRKPNVLIVKNIIDGSTYLDDVAQSVIDKKFGTCFSITGYMEQDASNSFIKMKPMEKLAFLESVAFKEENLEQLRDKTKDLIRQRNEEYHKILGEKGILERIFSEMQKPKEVRFPLEKKGPNAIKNVTTRYNQYEKTIKRYNNLIQKLKIELNDIKVLNTLLENKSENIDEITEKIQQLRLDETNIECISEKELYDMKKDFDLAISFIDFNNLKKEYDEIKTSLDVMKENELNELNKKIEDSNVWSMYEKDECKETIDSMKECLKDIEKILLLRNSLKKEDLNQKHQDIELKIKEKQELLHEKKILLEKIRNKKRSYICPCCSNSLCFEENKLLKYTNNDNNIQNVSEKDINTDIKQLESEIQILSNEKSRTKVSIENNQKIMNQIKEIEDEYEEELDKSQIETELEEISTYYTNEIQKEKEIRKMKEQIENEEFSSSYKLTKKKMLEIQQKLKVYDINLIPEKQQNIDIDSLRNTIRIEESKIEKVKEIKKAQESLLMDKEKKMKQYENMKEEHIQKYQIIQEEKSILSLIDEYKTEIENNEEKRKEELQKLEKLDEYNKYIEELNKYNDFFKKIEDLIKQEEEIKNKYNSAKVFLEKITETESIALVNLIDKINSHAQIYLESFFPDNPINVILSSFKETTNKITKPKINLEINYKGSDYDLNDLSGGEVARVILAFTLALAEIFDVPLIMLDECTASLDIESTAIVFDTIKEYFKNKNIIVVAHQCTEGIFDNVIQI